MRRALDELIVDGVKTTAVFHKLLLGQERFINGDFHTRYVQDVFSN